ncbi:MAG TPA: antitoxin family protein [Tepidisphaeraceae bacterium]|nr:antitoxin family protein [Tepidisphaeraceae bacterium]
MTIRAIYEDGVFKPTKPVALPEHSEVEIVLTPIPAPDDGLDAIYEVMGRRFESGRSDVAERHDEHQP